MTVVQLPTRFTIGGSEAAAAAGIDPHRSRVGLWLEKTGRVEREETEAMRWGTLLQPIIFAELEGRGYQVQPADPRQEWRDGDHTWMVGHPDGFADADGASVEAGAPIGSRPVKRGSDRPTLEPSHMLLEVNTVGQWAKREWNGQPPLAYVAQCQHYLHLTGLDRALLAVLVGGQRLETYEIEREQHAIDVLVELEQEFLERYLIPDEPPPARHDDADNLARMFPEHEPGRTVRLEKADLAALHALRARREQRAVIDEQISALENGLKMAMRQAEIALDAHDDEVIHWRTVTTKRVDVKRLRAERPDIAAEFVKPIQSRRFQPV